jgi:hypothetical protein
MSTYNYKKNTEELIKKRKYINRDFLSIKKDLISYAKEYFGDSYKDFNETSPGMMLLEMTAYIGDSLSFYIDQQFKEQLLPLAEEKRNMINISKTLGYNPKSIVPSIALLEFRQLLDAKNPGEPPNWDDALIIGKGSKVQSKSNSEIVFETLENLDFRVSGSAELHDEYIPYSQNSDGLTNKYQITRSVYGISGRSKTYNIKVGDSSPFLKINLPDNNVVDVVSVTDNHGGTWYEVDYLAQDKIFQEKYYAGTDNSAEDLYQYTSEASQSFVAAPSKLDESIFVNKKFTTETDEDGTMSLVFGNGTIRNASNGESILEQIWDDSQNINALYGGDIPDDWNSVTPSMLYSSLGEVPANTTLTITYRVGGGVESNVASDDLSVVSQIVTPDGVSNTTTAEATLVVTNPSPARGGADEETVDELREKARAAFSSQKRAVTREDYEGMIKQMPAKFGSVAKVFCKRVDPFEAISSTVIESSVDISSLSSIINGFTSYMTAHNDWVAGGEIPENLPDPAQFLDFDEVLGIDQGDIDAVQTAVDSITATADTVSHTGDLTSIVVYPLSYDHNKNLVKTPYFIRKNIKRYISEFKMLTDEVDIDHGHVINFGVFFRVVAHNNINKSELKLKIIDEIIKYFDKDTMKFNQVIYTNELENIIYGINGVKVIKKLELTQDKDLLELNNSLFAHTGDNTGVTVDGVPEDGTGGPTADTYGHAYSFAEFYTTTGWNNNGKGVIIPPHVSTPSIFELKNPYDNVRGIIE